ncbi:ATP synthase-coupling factor 6, mitochondrial-like [Physella acuta]|uniref:ATP synthase-coupling factor 6, mitochondrial-like n=1 Tax=Physella acuta TaxID=109671 RepID=UPI0027DC5A74|nr:ATP synthase-coupling factor 6, mitochondrial-like [Physella acuta]
MLRLTLQKLLPVITKAVCQGNYAAAAGAAQNLDPIQQLFLDKIREYRSRSKGGELVDVTAESEAALKEMLGNLERAYGAKGVDMTQFPKLQFSEPTIAWPGLSDEQKAKIDQAVKAEEAEQKKKIAAEEEEEGDGDEELLKL